MYAIRSYYEALGRQDLEHRRSQRRRRDRHRLDIEALQLGQLGAFQALGTGQADGLEAHLVAGLELAHLPQIGLDQGRRTDEAVV